MIRITFNSKKKCFVVITIDSQHFPKQHSYYFGQGCKKIGSNSSKNNPQRKENPISLAQSKQTAEYTRPQLKYELQTVRDSRDAQAGR